MDDEVSIVTEELVTGEWRAYDNSTYDGAPEHSGNLNPEGQVVGVGKSEQEAVDDLLEQMGR